MWEYMRHSYMRKLVILCLRNKIPEPVPQFIDVWHAPKCPIFRGRACICAATFDFLSNPHDGKVSELPFDCINIPQAHHQPAATSRHGWELVPHGIMNHGGLTQPNIFAVAPRHHVDLESALAAYIAWKGPTHLVEARHLRRPSRLRRPKPDDFRDGA